MWRKIRLDAENARPVAFQRSEGHRRSGRQIEFKRIRGFLSNSIFGGGLWISRGWEEVVALAFDPGVMIVSEA